MHILNVVAKYGVGLQVIRVLTEAGVRKKCPSVEDAMQLVGNVRHSEFFLLKNGIPLCYMQYKRGVADVADYQGPF